MATTQTAIEADLAKRQNAIPAFLKDSPKKLLIGGKWVAARSGKTFETINPATEEVLALVAEGDKADVDEAVKVARAAFEAGKWSSMSPHERGRLLLTVADLIDKDADELAMLESLDNGKPVVLAKNIDVRGTAGAFRYFAGWPTKIYGETNPSDPSMFNYTLREPMGVCGLIVPWNFPLLMAVQKIAPALACGNTMVLKPAEQTPMTALRLGEILLEAGIPEGVVNVITGFGPGAAAIPFKDENDAVLRGNDTTYGLAAAVWTRDISRAHRVARALKAGTVWINNYGASDVSMPFGGYKQSGFGREGGRHVIDIFTQIKSVYVKL